MSKKIKQSPGPRSDQLQELKQQCPLPTLMQHLRMSKYNKKSCKSPFRDDQHASWGTYKRDGLYRWKDHGTDDCGDELTFLARLLNIDESNFVLLVQLYEAIANEVQGAPTVQPETVEERKKPDPTPFRPGTDLQIKRVAELRGISIEALGWAEKRGLLVFGNHRNFEVFGVTDKSGEVIEVRRLDGKDFPGNENQSAHKSHSMAGSEKSWPVGIEEAVPYPCIAMVEGLPDLLAAHDFILKEQGPIKDVKCAPVAMLGASSRISEDALKFFEGKTVRFFAHGDQAGMKAAVRWQEQLTGIAKRFDIFDMTAVSGKTGQQVKDLNDLLKVRTEALLKDHPNLNAIMPK